MPFIPDMLYLRAESTLLRIGIGKNGSIYLNASLHDVHFDLKDILEVTVGPNDNYDGIKACLTYNSPRASKPGYQSDRGVSFVEPILIRTRIFI